MISFIQGYLKRPTALTLLTNLSVLGLGTVSGILLSRALGATGRGDLVPAQVIPMILGLLSSLGMNEAVSFTVSRSADDGAARVLLVNGCCLALFGSVVASGIAFFLLPVVLPGERQEVVRASQIALLYGIGMSQVMVVQGWFRGRGAMFAWNAFRVLPGACWAIGVAVVAASGASVFRASIALGASALASGFLAVLSVRHELSGRVSKATLGDLLRFGAPAAGSTVPRALNTSFDQVFLLPFTSPEQLGGYATAVSWSNVVSPISTASIMTKFKQIATSDPATRLRLVLAALRKAAALSSLVALSVAAVTPLLYPLVFGESYRSSVKVAIAMAGVAGLLAMKDSVTHCLWACGEPRLLLASDLLALGVTLLGLLVLGPQLGVWGAVIASGLAYLVAATTGFALLRRRLQQSVPRQLGPVTSMGSD